MSKQPPSTKEELGALGRGLGASLVYDVVSVVIWIAICVPIAMLFGLSAKFGLILGAFIGIASRSFTRPLFDYIKRRRQGNDDA